MGRVDESCFEPKSATQVFKRGVAECVRDGGSAWVTVVAMLLAPTAIVVAGQYVIWRTGAGELLETMQKGGLDPKTLDPGELFGGIALAVGVGAVSGILSFLAQYASGVAMARMMAERALGRAFGPAQAWDFVLGRASKIISGAAALMLVLVAGAVVGEIPGSIIGAAIGMGSGRLQPGAPPPIVMRIAPLVTMVPVLVALAVYLVAMVAVTGVENQGGFAALSRSWRLASGHFRHVLGAIVIAGLAFTAPGMAVGMLAQTPVAAHLRESLGAATGMAAVTGVSCLLSLLLSPFMLTVQAIIYLDLRSRQREETFTAYELALDVGGELPEGVAGPTEGVAPELPVVPEPPRGGSVQPPSDTP